MGECKVDDVVIYGVVCWFGEECWSEFFVVVDMLGFFDINCMLFVDVEGKFWFFYLMIFVNFWEFVLFKVKVVEEWGEGLFEW